MEYFPIILLVLIGLVCITRPLTVLLHELGHAIPAILLTGRKVSIYIGSHGDPNKSFKIDLGALTIFFRYNLFAWRLGLCVPSAEEISINKQIIYTLTGPITSLIIATIACYFTFVYDLHGFLKLFLVVFFGSALFDLAGNLIPNESGIKLNDGRIAYNDGYTLKRLFYYKSLPKEYSEAAGLYHEKKFSEAAILFAQLLSVRKDENIYRLAINAHLQIKDYGKAKELSQSFALTEKMNSDDLHWMAFSYSQLGLINEAMDLYDKALRLNPENQYSLNDKGYTLNLMNRFEEAIPFFDKTIELDKNAAYAYNNRGLAKLKLGKTEEGLQDINRSFELDINNSYAYKNLGIYYFDKAEFDEALRLFEKAKQLDGATDMIDELIQQTKDNLNWE